MVPVHDQSDRSLFLPFGNMATISVVVGGHHHTSCIVQTMAQTGRVVALASVVFAIAEPRAHPRPRSQEVKYNSEEYDSVDEENSADVERFIVREVAVRCRVRQESGTASVILCKQKREDRRMPTTSEFQN